MAEVNQFLRDILPMTVDELLNSEGKLIEDLQRRFDAFDVEFKAACPNEEQVNQASRKKKTPGRKPDS